MAKRTVVLASSNPVVFSRDQAGGVAWFYRAANEQALHGPFPSRDAAVAYALAAMKDPAAATTLATVSGLARSGSERRAA